MVSRCKLVTGHVYTYTAPPARVHRYVHICVGKFNPVKVNEPHTTCADANSSVIATEAKCLEAATLLSVDEKFTGRIVETTQLPYCGFYTAPKKAYAHYFSADSYYTFEKSGMKEYEGDYSCAHPHATCVCNKGTHLRATTHASITTPSLVSHQCQQTRNANFPRNTLTEIK